MKSIRNLILLFLILPLTGFSQKDVLKIAYGNEPQQILDLFLPANVSDKTPVAIFIHGGAWSLGDRYYTDSHAKKLRDRGIVVANIEYRYVSPTLDHKGLEKDVSDAIAKVKSLSPEYNFRNSAYHIIGISAGAHLALMQAYLHPSETKSVTSICGPVRFNTEESRDFIAKLGLSKTIEMLAGSRYANGKPDTKFTDISPYSIVKKVPTLLIHGTKDELVLYSNAMFMKEVLEKHHVENKLITIEGAGHSAGMDKPESEAKNLDEIEKWIRKYD
ncbi:alpha/beta hydrolase [Flavobacterium silvaticum]|uniref:Alpha/beta hydrolase n=1 Tax=Flavobacterium silvaticum TaxID=1852020 RepID=A0A972FJJ1_9FLAO|nr:alpha/beta hydrolase [Flavobacterium silvaticum]NMH26837.1 alpha/beta hydrolase [Flavobacterium silvaticum]